MDSTTSNAFGGARHAEHGPAEGVRTVVSVELDEQGQPHHVAVKGDGGLEVVRAAGEANRAHRKRSRPRRISHGLILQVPEPLIFARPGKASHIVRRLLYGCPTASHGDLRLLSRDHVRDRPQPALVVVLGPREKAVAVAYPVRPTHTVLPEFLGTSGIKQTAAQRQRLIEFVRDEYINTGRSLRELGELTGRSQGAIRRAAAQGNVQLRSPGVPQLGKE